MTDPASQVSQILHRVLQSFDRLGPPPSATYRVQLRAEFGFADTIAVLDYLKRLGVSHVYCSPYLTATKGSTHGYDIVDARTINPALGGAEGHGKFVAALRSRDMGHIVDVVPNHMGVASDQNAWWNDVLENGPGSPYAGYFDIDWHPVTDPLENKVLLPILGDQYGAVLEGGDISLGTRGGAFVLHVYDRTLPIAGRTFALPLADMIGDLEDSLADDDEDLIELRSVLTAVRNLPERTETDPDRLAERLREQEVVKGRLERLFGSGGPAKTALQRTLERFNGTPGDSRSFDRLDELVDAQAYRPSYWKVASDEINYRRFFDINGLAALCVEDPQVFADSHELIVGLLAEGKLDGLRIDHIDGLFDPAEYLWRLHWSYIRALGKRAHAELMADVEIGEDERQERWRELEPECLAALWPTVGGPDPRTLFPLDHDRNHHSASATVLPPGRPPLYVVVEKILGPDELLPADWPTAGTTGYDGLNLLSGLFCDAEGLAEVIRDYSRFTEIPEDFRTVGVASKRLILRTSMSSELAMLAYRLDNVSEQHRKSRDFTLQTLRIALRETLVYFPVYRTYVSPRGVGERDRRIVSSTVAVAKRHNPDVEASVFDFVRRTLLLEWPEGIDADDRAARELFVGRYQQVTSPVMAKGIEDTCFYIHLPLLSLNEVGGEPVHGPTTADEFHQDNADRLVKRPSSLVCTTTHDTKRSEDVRARITVLSELSGRWRSAYQQWSKHHRTLIREVHGVAAPDPNDEYLFYQSLVGVWPVAHDGADPLAVDDAAMDDLVGRMQGYMEKATREAKRHTGWVNPDAGYDAAVREFVASALADADFTASVREFVAGILDWGLFTGLSQTLLKLTMPGVPDVYQGQELWDYSLVDPDNRRPVDYARRANRLDELEAVTADGLADLAADLTARPWDDRAKLLVTWTALQLRRTQPELFRSGAYVPLPVAGAKADHLAAFARVGEAGVAVVLAPRLLVGLTPADEGARPKPPVGPEVWGDTTVSLAELDATRLTDRLTGRDHAAAAAAVPVGELLTHFPVALLTG